MSPEQVAGDEVDPAWDIWALAVIAYEMLTGGHPFRRTLVFAGTRRIAGERDRHQRTAGRWRSTRCRIG